MEEGSLLGLMVLEVHCPVHDWVRPLVWYLLSLEVGSGGVWAEGSSAERESRCTQLGLFHQSPLGNYLFRVT